jgi:hypothetical protein
MGTPQVGGWSTELATLSLKNLTAIETSTIVKLLRPYVPVGTKRTRRRRRRNSKIILITPKTN